VCDASERLGTRFCAVMLHSVSGPVVLMVDNSTELADDHRLYAVSARNWEDNPIFALLRRSPSAMLSDEDVPRFLAQGRARGNTSSANHPFFAPLLCPDGWFGTIMWGSAAPLAIALERELAMLATRMSVWSTDHGIGRIPDAARAELGPQQARVARLAARGLTNPEIADDLEISVNTVKLRLKQVFERLGVSTRIELAHMLLRLAPLEEAGAGVTHVARATVTRAAATVVKSGKPPRDTPPGTGGSRAAMGPKQR